MYLYTYVHPTMLQPSISSGAVRTYVCCIDELGHVHGQPMHMQPSPKPHARACAPVIWVLGAGAAAEAGHGSISGDDDGRRCGCSAGLMTVSTCSNAS